MKKLFDGLRPFQKAEFVIMILLSFAIPFYWLAAQYCEVALVACAVFKIIFEQKGRLNHAQMKWKWAYFAFMATWLVYLIGMIYTTNADEGWFQVSKKLGFLLFPLVFLLSDMSYLTKTRIRAIFYALVAGVLIFFTINVIWATIDVIFNGLTTKRFFDEDLMKLYYVHHTYMSMYVLLAFGFCFFELYQSKNARLRIFNAVTMLMLAVFVILLNSRAGILTMVLEIIMLWCYITFVAKNKKVGIVSGLIVVAAGISILLAFPERFSRITETVKNVSSANKTDRRLVQYVGYKPIMENNWLFGVGTGDRPDEIKKSYENYRNELISSIVAVKGVDNEEFIMQREKLLDTITVLTEYGCNWNEVNDDVVSFINENSEKYCCTPESVLKMYAQYIYIEDAVYFELDSHNQFFDTIISIGICGLILLLAYFLISIFVMVKYKKIDHIYLIFIMIIVFNSLFESVFEGQVGIIFFNFFNILMFNSLTKDVSSDIKSLENAK